MPKKSRFSPEVKIRVINAYHDILKEAVPSDFKNLTGRAYPRAEIKELVDAYGITTTTLRAWSKEMGHAAR